MHSMYWATATRFALPFADAYFQSRPMTSPITSIYFGREW